MARIFLDVQVGDENRVKTLSAKIGDHLFESGEVLAVDGERGVALLIVDVEIDDVGRDFLVAKGFDNLTRAGLGVIAVAALLITKGPERRQRRTPGQGRVFFDDSFRLRTRNEVIVQLTAFRAKRKVVPRFLAEIENTSIGVVEEHAVSNTFAQPDKERDGFVEWVGGFLPAKFIRVPVGEGAVAAVHGTGFVAETIVVFIGRHFLPDMHARAVPGHGQAGFIGKQDVSRSIGKINEQRRFRDCYVDGPSGYLYFIFSVVDLYGATDVVQRHLGQGPRDIFRKASVWSDPHAYDPIVKLCNANLCRTGSQLHTVFETVPE